MPIYLKPICLFALLCALAPSSQAQCDQDYPEVLRLAKESLEQRDYQLAIYRFLDARDICPDRKGEVNQWIKTAFEQIQGEKNAADSALMVAEFEKKRAEYERRRSDSSLAVANRVLDQMYFYEGNFGLTLKKLDSELTPKPKYRFGFIDQEGNTRIPFEFEEASPFSLDDGFARVSRYGKDFLLDTLGNTYLVAGSIGELTDRTEALDLHENLPNELPDSFKRYINLKIVLLYEANKDWFGANKKGKMTALPKEIGQLLQLEKIYLSDNQLTTLPKEIGQLHRLQKFDVSGNQLTALPKEIGQLYQLKELDVSGNQLATLPKEIGMLHQLNELDLSENLLNKLPTEIGQLTQLKSFNLRMNQLEELPEEICRLTQLQHLSLFDNHVKELPAEIGHLNELLTLDLHKNQLTEIPSEICYLIHLKYFFLSQNQLTKLPSEIGQLSQLKYFSLRFNQLSELPKGIGELQQLQFLDLSFNNLSELPLEIGQLQKLKELDLSYNSFNKEEVDKLKKLLPNCEIKF